MKITASHANSTASRALSAGPSQDSEKQGALIIIDSFHSSDSHGHLVEGAARSLGPVGAVHRYHHHQQVEGRGTLPHVTAVKDLQANFSREPLAPEEAKEGFQNFVSRAVSGNLEWAGTLLEQVSAAGFRNSVINYSQGLDSITLMVLAKHALGKGSHLTEAAQKIYFENLVQAVTPEAQAPLSVPEIDNLMLQKIKSTRSQSPEIQEATARWRDRIREFEKDNNSVVIAAGNSGRDLQALQAGGFDIDGSEDLNIFSVPEATVVGAAVNAKNGGIALAAPSSFGDEVDFIASGDHGTHFGTSFAAPKVANALRAAHIANPNFTSEQAEEWLKAELAETGLVRDHEIAILDSARASCLLRHFG